MSKPAFIITRNNMIGKLRKDQKHRDTILDTINKNLDCLSTKIECQNRNWEDKVDQPRLCAYNARRNFRANDETLVHNDRIQYFLDKPKFNIPPFQAKYDPEAYCEWESKIELMFRYYKCSEEEKVQLATLGFSDYALSWWIQLGIDCQRNRERIIETWNELKQVMRKRYVPSHYYREVLTRLQLLVQGNQSVDEYFKEMEMLIQRANIQEDEEITIVRFVNGLNVSIANALNLDTYIDLEEMVHKAIEIEQQFQQHQSHPFGASHYYRGPSSNFTFKNSKPPYATNKLLSKHAEIKPFEWKSRAPTKHSSTSFKQPISTNFSPQQQRAHDIECFTCKGRGHYNRDCANTRLLLIKEDDELCELEKNDNENSFFESIELDEIETSCSPIEIYCTELNIHNTCEGDMGREEKSCEKTERKETFSDKSLLNGPNLVSENPYEVKLESSQMKKENEKQENTHTKMRSGYVLTGYVLTGYVLTNSNLNLFSGVSLLQDFKNPMTDSKLYYSTIDRQFYLWERAKDSGTNLLEEVGNKASLKAQFQTYGCDGFTLLQDSTTMSKAKQIKSELDQRQDSRTNLFEERENDTCTDGVKSIRFQSSKLSIFRLGKSEEFQ
ncbi:hypothetical protein PVK06_025361 [Gossypium arboreum]|uniref:CCHC-type domain-containing protein n=1 Tax=Gossypium arboreum TaxID=29729 RepID=A0ABR0PGL6_GOSAR|nr:hypothetical protein PVK06_025361 [Gossypium arboreum]